MKAGDRVMCIGEFCYKLTYGHIYTIDTIWKDNTVTLKEYKLNYSMQLFMGVNEYRRNTILKIKEKIKGS